VRLGELPVVRRTLYFPGAAISTGGCPPQTPRLDLIKAYIKD